MDQPKEGKDFAYSLGVVLDQGNGYSYCSNCHFTLDLEDKTCPHCKLPLVYGETYIPSGGSDF